MKFLKLFELDSYSQKMEALEVLVQYVIEEMGGIEIND